MTVAIVTDSCSDITQEEARKHGITVVPAWVRFGDHLFRDGVDIGPDEFYHRITTGQVHPQTSAPSPGEFVEVYEKLARYYKEIVSIHVTRRHSVTYGSAILAKDIVERDIKGCRIEVVDSEALTMWQGLVVYAAKRAADVGATLHQIVDKAHETMIRTRGLGLLDTLSYAVKGGRLGRVVAAAELFLSLKPLLTIRQGEVKTAGFIRKHEKGVEKLRALISNSEQVEDLAIVHGTMPEEAESLVSYAQSVHPDIKPRLVRLGPAIGTHGGPKTLIVVVNHGKTE
ncbi:MAG: DegV family protein [Chloroflexota bacterium]